MDISLIGNSETLVAILIVTLVTLLFLYRIVYIKSKTRLDLVLLLGPCGTGKTSLFYLWKNRKVPDTVTSQVISRGFVLKEKGVDEEVVDCPGHARLRNVAYELIPRAKKIVYFADPSNAKEAAEHLFQMFVLPKLSPKTEIMICQNKTDMYGTDVTDLVNQLNKEIQILQKTKSEDGEYVGVEGENFNILEHAPVQVIAGHACVKSASVDQIEKFLR
jgi:signal recognition particle receptor subunit beta